MNVEELSEGLYNTMDSSFYLRKCVQLYYKTFFKVTTFGLEKFPRARPLIIASNHVSRNDPVLLAAFLDPNIKFMAKEELFRIPVVRSIIKRLGAFPVCRRGTGIGAIRHSIRLLKSGQLVGIFPEGTRNAYGDKILPFKPGVGFIATKIRGILVVPVAINYRRHRLSTCCEVVVGDPIEIGEQFMRDYRSLSRYIMESVHQLKSSLTFNESSSFKHQSNFE